MAEQRYECDCGAVYSYPDGPIHCADNRHGQAPQGTNWADVGPDLLAALKDIQKWALGDQARAQPANQRMVSVLQIANDAIAKAKGE